MTEKAKILVIDDEHSVRWAFEKALQKANYEVALADNGSKGLELYYEFKPDITFVDIRMPEMDGLEASKHIRAMDREDAKEIPIIALTANAFEEDVQRSLQAGLNAHLSKPVEPDTLFVTLESFIKP